jgi:hypothetical protein
VVTNVFIISSPKVRCQTHLVDVPLVLAPAFDSPVPFSIRSYEISMMNFGPATISRWSIPFTSLRVLPANAPSRRVAEKIGSKRNGEVIHASLPHLLFRLPLA